MTRTGFEHYSTEALAWWVNHMDNDGCKLCPTTTSPEVGARVRAEYAKRPQKGPREKMPRRVQDAAAG